MGRWRLADQIDTSHRFLYAHRFWPQVKAAIAGADSAGRQSLPAMITQIADAACGPRRVDRDRLLGITAVGLMTLRQVGAAALAAAPGAVNLSEAAGSRSPHQVLQRRAKDDWQGLFGFSAGTPSAGRSRSTRAIPRRRFRSSTDRRSPAAPRRTSANIGRRDIRAAFPTKDRFRSNAVRPRAARAGSACSAAPKNSRRSSPTTRAAG